jgi:hypothetical protein
MRGVSAAMADTLLGCCRLTRPDLSHHDSDCRKVATGQQLLQVGTKGPDSKTAAQMVPGKSQWAERDETVNWKLLVP